MAPLVIKTCPGILFPGGDFLPLWWFCSFFSQYSLHGGQWPTRGGAGAGVWGHRRCQRRPRRCVPGRGRRHRARYRWYGWKCRSICTTNSCWDPSALLKPSFFAGCKDSESHISWILCNSSWFFVEAGSLSLHPSPAFPLCLPLNQEKCKNNLLWFTRNYAFC